MVLEPIHCPSCNSIDVVKYSQMANGVQRYHCRKVRCARATFMGRYQNRGYLPEVKASVVEMALNGSGIRDTARVLKISPSIVINELKKRIELEFSE